MKKSTLFNVSGAILGIGAAVITACPRVAIEDGPTWSIPLLTVPELQILLGRRDSEPYPFDEFP